MKRSLGSSRRCLPSSCPAAACTWRWWGCRQRPPARALVVTLGVLWELPWCPALPRLLNDTLIASIRKDWMPGILFLEGDGSGAPQEWGSSSSLMSSSAHRASSSHQLNAGRQVVKGHLPAPKNLLMQATFCDERKSQSHPATPLSVRWCRRLAPIWRRALGVRASPGRLF